MDEQEMNRKCAEKLGLRIDHRWRNHGVYLLPNKTNLKGRYRYAPLDYPDQFLRLVWRFKPHMVFDPEENQWSACVRNGYPVRNASLEYAVCQAIAQLPC